MHHVHKKILLFEAKIRTKKAKCIQTKLSGRQLNLCVLQWHRKCLDVVLRDMYNDGVQINISLVRIVLYAH